MDVHFKYCPSPWLFGKCLLSVFQPYFLKIGEILFALLSRKMLLYAVISSCISASCSGPEKMSSNSSTSLGIPDDLSMPQQPVLDDTSPIIQGTRYLAQSTGLFPFWSMSLSWFRRTYLFSSSLSRWYAHRWADRRQRVAAAWYCIYRWSSRWSRWRRTCRCILVSRKFDHYCLLVLLLLLCLYAAI